MADVSTATKFFPTAKEGFTTTTSGSISSGATSVGLNSVSGLTNGATMVFVIDPTDSTKKQAFTGVIDTAGSQVTGVVWTEGTNVAHSSGATVVDYETATHWALYSKGLLVQHTQAGAHTSLTNTSGMTTDSLTVSGAATVGTTLGVTGVASLNGGTTLPAGDIATADIAADAITAAKMLYGMIRNRQGGSSGDATWATSGTTNTDTTAKDVFIQVGTNVSTNGGSKSVTFPTAFTYAPVVFIQNVAAAAHFCTIDTTPTTTGFAFECWNTANALVDAEVVFWVAIGQ